MYVYTYLMYTWIYFMYISIYPYIRAFLDGPEATMQETQDMPAGFLGREDSREEANGNSLSYSCLKNPMDSGAWQATVQRVTKS